MSDARKKLRNLVLNSWQLPHGPDMMITDPSDKSRVAGVIGNAQSKALHEETKKA